MTQSPSIKSLALIVILANINSGLASLTQNYPREKETMTIWIMNSMDTTDVTSSHPLCDRIVQLLKQIWSDMSHKQRTSAEVCVKQDTNNGYCRSNP